MDSRLVAKFAAAMIRAGSITVKEDGSGLYGELARCLCSYCGTGGGIQGNPLAVVLTSGAFSDDELAAVESAAQPSIRAHQKSEHPDESMQAAENLQEFQKRVQDRAEEMRVFREAKRLIASEEVVLPGPGEFLEYSEFMSLDFGSEDWLFEGLIERGQRVMLSGYRKRGKTTVFGYVLKAYCDGGRFLGQFDAGDPGECPVLYLNLEIPKKKMQQYLDRWSIRNAAGKLFVYNGLGASCDILNDSWFEFMGNLMADRQVCSLLVDPLRQIYRGDENDNTLAKEVCDRFDRWMSDIDSLQNIFIVAHSGHESTGQAESEDGAHFARPRGASKWADWPDVLLSLTSDRDENRYFAAQGRNGEFRASVLRLGDTSQGLYLQLGTTQRDVRAERVYEDVLNALERAGGPLNMTALKAAVPGDDNAVIAAVSRLAGLGQVTSGPNPADRRQTLVALTEAGRMALGGGL